MHACTRPNAKKKVIMDITQVRVCFEISYENKFQDILNSVDVFLLHIK